MSITKEDLENMSIDQLEAVMHARSKKGWHKGVLQASEIMCRKIEEEQERIVQEMVKRMKERSSGRSK